MTDPLKTELRNGVISKVISLFGILTLIISAVYGNSGITIIIFFTLSLFVLELIFGFLTGNKPLPYILMLSSPLTLIHYSTISDFNIRLIILLFIIYILSISVSESGRRIKIPICLSRPLFLWLVPFIVFSVVSTILFVKGIHLSGDEPHYLMVTQSLVDDGDLNLKNNVEDETYKSFIPVKLRAHMIIRNGKHLSYHMPGMPFLLTPFYILFKTFHSSLPPQLFFRISASFVNAFFMLSLFFMLKFFFPGKDIYKFWFLSIFFAPTLFHSVHLFPELPAATLLMGAFLLIYSEKEKPLTAGILFSLSIWFHVKYYPALFIFALFVMIRYAKKRDLKSAAAFFIPPVVSSLILILYCKILYDTFSPANIFPPENYFTTPLILKIKVLFSYLLDQRDGLLLYSPVLFLFLPGLKERFRYRYIPLSIITLYLLFHSVTTVRGAYSPAGRPVIFVYWTIIILTAGYYFHSKRRVVFRFLSGISLSLTVLLLSFPLFVYQPVYSSTTFRWSGMLRFLGSDKIDIPHFFPSFITHPNKIYIQNPLWIIFLILSSIFYYKKKKSGLNKKREYLIFPLFFILFFTLSFFPHLYFSPKGLYIKDGIRFFNNSGNFVYIKESNSFRVKSNSNYDLFFDRNGKRKNFILSLESPEIIEIKIFNGKKRIFKKHRGKKFRWNIRFNNLKSFSFNNKKLIHIGMQLKSGDKDLFPSLTIRGVK